VNSLCVFNMKILQVFPHSYTSMTKGGGILEYVRNISERLGKKHDVTVYATNPGRSFSRYETINGVRVERFRRFAPNRSYFFSWEMLLRLRKSEFDIVHGHCYQGFPLHFSVLAKRKKFVASTHFHGVGHSVFRNSLIRLLRPFGKRTLRKADRIVAVSEYEKSLLCGQFELDPSKIVVIPCGVDFSEFRGLKKRKHPFRSILYVGRLEGYKGAQFLVEVLPRLDEDVVLNIVGRGVLRPILEKRARELNVLDRVKFYQNLPRRDLLQKFVDADVFVLLSRYEAYSMAVAEALVAGTPCIVANVSALKEWIDGKHCFGTEYPIDIGGLARLIDEVIECRDRINGTKQMTEKIKDWDDVVEQLERVYRE
jgi:glycosyltransferase involved in cell wall biosynthesis